MCIHKNYSRICKGSHEVVALFNSVPCLTPVQTFPVSFSTHSFSQRASRTFTASAEVSLELLQSVIWKSFLISSRSLFSWVLALIKCLRWFVYNLYTGNIQTFSKVYPMDTWCIHQIQTDIITYVDVYSANMVCIH